MLAKKLEQDYETFTFPPEMEEALRESEEDVQAGRVIEINDAYWVDFEKRVLARIAAEYPK